MSSELTHDWRVLYHASLERRQAASRAFDNSDYVMAIYLAGLAVECLLQAFALQAQPVHDARHDLSAWLGKCPATLVAALRTKPTRESWNLLLRVWRSNLRYLSIDGLLGFIRERKLNRGVSGGPDAIMKQVARKALDAAKDVHDKGLAIWPRFKTK